MLSAKQVIESYRFLFLFVLILSYFIVMALSAQALVTSITSLSFVCLIIYSLCVIGKEQRVLWLSVCLVGVTVVGITLFPNHARAYILSKLFFSAFFYLLMVYACLFYTFKDKVVTKTTLFGALCAYLFIGLCFSSVYLFIYQLNPDSFIGVTSIARRVDDDLIYFSFVSMTTLGYGDVLPTAPLTKTLSWMEAYIGQAYLAILTAQLVGRYVNQQNIGRTK